MILAEAPPLATIESSDLRRGTQLPTIAARFHRGLARAIARMATQVMKVPVEAGEAQNVVALSGGCFQNRILFELCVRELEERNFRVMTRAAIPCNDGGISFGQAAIAAATMLKC